MTNHEDTNSIEILDRSKINRAYFTVVKGNQDYMFKSPTISLSRKVWCLVRQCGHVNVLDCRSGSGVTHLDLF